MLFDQDGVTFQHVASFESEEAHAIFRNLPAFKNFTAGGKDRCEKAPLAIETSVVGSFGFL